MRTKFPGYYKPTKEEFEDLWKTATIVLDTNVLLDLYRYSDETVSVLLENINVLKDRIYIPYQVSLEYHRNLNEVISTQIENYKKTITTLEDFKKQLDAKRSHPFLAKELHEEINAFCIKFDDALNCKKVEIEKLITDNPIKEKLAEILDSNVGDSFSEGELEKIFQEGAVRFQDKIPPGYKDEKNKKGNEKYGDLVIWKEILKLSKEKNSNIILVSGDVKEDWFLIHFGKTVGPRPELVQEFKSNSNSLFYIYPTNQFLEFSNQYLKTSIDQEILEEVGKVMENFYNKLIVDFELTDSNELKKSTGSVIISTGETSNSSINTDSI